MSGQPYVYAGGNPVNATDPTGHFLDWIADAASIGLDLKDIADEGLNWGNGLTLAADVVLGIAPFVPAGVGWIKRSGKLLSNADGIDDAAHLTGAFDVVRYGDKSAGFENHLGVLDIWASYNIPGYISRALGSPAMRLTGGSLGQHAATKRVYREWLFQKTGKRVGGRVDWSTVSAREVQDLSERMFDVAQVPFGARRSYYGAFHQYIYTGQFAP